MARPTLSKVLYIQQIGSGLQQTSSQETVCDCAVVDA